MQQCRRLQHLHHVLTVVAPRAVAAQRHCDASSQHLWHARHARSQVHITDRAMNDNGLVFGDQVKLVIIQPNAVNELHLRPQHADFGQPLDMSIASRLQIHLHFGLGFGHVNVRPRTPLLRDVVGVAHGLVGTAPGDERPKLHANAALFLYLPSLAQPRRLAHNLLLRFHKRWMVAYICPAPRQQKAQSRFVGRAADAIIVAWLGVDILMVDHGGRATANILDHAHHGRYIRFLFGQRLRHRPDGRFEPIEQRFVIGQPANKGLEEVRVRVHHAGHYGH